MCRISASSDNAAELILCYFSGTKGWGKDLKEGAKIETEKQKMKMHFHPSGSHKQVHRVKLHIPLCSEKKKKWNIDYRAIVRWWHKRVINGWAKIKGPIKEMTPVSQGEGQIERGVNLVVIHLTVSGMEIKIKERVLMLEITVHLSRTPATRDIKGLFQMRGLSEKVRLCGIVTIGNTILYSFLYFDCSGTWKLLEGAH